jgi:hypothetical protein
MNIKFIAIAVCAGYGIWFAAIGGKQVTSEHVEALYRDYAAAFDRGDGKAVCDMFSDSVHGRFNSTSRTMPVKEVVSKAVVCASVDDFKRSKKQMEDAVGNELYTNIEYTIKSISVAPDKKSASAEVLMEIRIGTEQGALLDMRSTQVDVIKRNFGKAQFVQSDGSVSFFK